jgi:hypothetical protein
MRKVLVAVCILLLLFTSYVLYDLRTNFYVCPVHGVSRIVDNMPLVNEPPLAAYAAPPEELRGKDVIKWMKVGLKISVSGSSGSGTIVYYDRDTGYAYVQSCGHLWDGNMSSKDGERRNVTCKVITWYHNDVKLPQPKTYPCEVIYYNNEQGKDCSLSRFKPDWVPDYYPIAPENFLFQKGAILHSIGCDGGREIANYEVVYMGTRGEPWPDMVTVHNSPRPGRSGGGLLSDEGLYVGICWGTSDYSGTGNGYFTTLKTLRYFNNINGYELLNNVSNSLARKIPVVDRNNPQGSYRHDYIPLPGGKL